MIPSGRSFFKMTGSGNDFVFVDARKEPADPLDQPTGIRAICARGTGVGADGIVFLEHSEVAAVRMRYLNSDGSVAALCGNATLCAARLLVELGGAAHGERFGIETAAGVLEAVVDASAGPTIQMPQVADLQLQAPVALESGELRAGFATVGIPHLVVACGDVEAVDVEGRGRPLRFSPAFPDGTNVDFVARGADGRWFMRTYERGVEGETLACGTGAVASAVLLDAWDPGAGGRIVTRSGQELRVTVDRVGGSIRPTLAGEARVVYCGTLAEFAGA